MLETLWTTAALNDIANLHAFIADDNPAAAAEQLRRIVTSIERTLGEFPSVGRVGLKANTRRYPVPQTPFIVEYRIRNNVLRILRVFHHAQIWR